MFDWINGKYYIFKSLYRKYIKSKFVKNINLFEKENLFKECGINSILINNFITYTKIIPSDLSSNPILMIGRVTIEMGIQVFEYIIGASASGSCPGVV